MRDGLTHVNLGASGHRDGKALLASADVTGNSHFPPDLAISGNRPQAAWPLR
jgi:hypothetical protein